MTQIRFSVQQILVGMLIAGLFTAMLATTVSADSFQGRVSGDDVVVGQEHIGNLSAGRDTQLNGTHVSGNVMVGRSVQAVGCQIEGNLSAGRDVDLRDCTSVNNISAGRGLRLYNSNVNSNVSSGRELVLVNATIQGNASAGGEVTVEKSTINQTLAAATDYLALNGSTVRDIKIHQRQGDFSGTGGVIINGSSHHAIIGSNNSVISSNGGVVISGHRGGGSLISVGPGSISNVNGYAVKSSGTQTTVITPQNSIYVNGNRVSGNGPKDYAAYKAQTPGAPTIQGPGWVEQGNGHASASSEAPQGPEQVVELKDGSVVTGRIYFESGRGKVIVNNGSRFEGTVEGGVVVGNRS